MVAKLFDIIRVMERLAPLALSEEWDNSGLQVGHKQWPVKTICIALDPTTEVIDHVCKRNINLLITHHPLIFKPLKSIDFGTPLGSIILKSAKNRLSIFSAHTNLDSVKNGINDILSEKIGLNNIYTLGKPVSPDIFKLVVYVSEEHKKDILDALFETSAGTIGSYSNCSFSTMGNGTFKSGVNSQPAIGRKDGISHVDEVRVETVVNKKDLKSVVETLKKSHPYETMAYDVYPLLTLDNKEGIGRVGELNSSVKLRELAKMVKQRLNIQSVKIAGNPELIVQRVAVCSGSGSGLMKDFFSSGAQVYISGDFRYHDARAVEEAGCGLIDIGHFESEHLALEMFANHLQDALDKERIDASIELYEEEKSPFIML